MQIKELKQKLVEAIEAETNHGILEEIQELLSISKDYNEAVFPWEQTKEFNEAIEESIQQAERGEVISHEDVLKIIKSKYLDKNCLD
jgi:predicted transcriptional regulator